MSKVTTLFGVFEREIQKGESVALAGWWKAGEEAVALFKGNASAYAKAAAPTARRNTEGTIRVNVSAVVRAIKGGYTLAEFVAEGMGIDHVKATLAGSGKRKKGKKVVLKPSEKVIAAANELKTAEMRSVLEVLAEQLGLKLVKR